MKAQQRIDKVLEGVKERVQEEVGSLLGVTFKLSELESKFTSRADFLAEQAGKKVIAKIDLTGEIEGLGALILSVKDAIRLGGSLIMLPAAELDEVVKSENYTEEIEDSYGEIANIIAGSYTKAFEDSYPKDFRFVRKEQEVIAPAKIDSASQEPFPEQGYYWVKTAMKLDEQEMSELHMLIPAEPFGLQNPQDAAKVEEHPEVDENSDVLTDSLSEEDPEKNKVQESAASADDSAGDPPENDNEAEKNRLSPEKLEKHRKLVDSLLLSSKNTIAEEVGAMLGVSVKLGDLANSATTKEEFFQEEINGKQVVADMHVVGELEGKSYLFISLKDAIRIGSTLIMLPPNEMEAAVKEDEFSTDINDAYGEIANIISGAYTSVFQEQYSKKIRFIKKEIEVVSPAKVDCESNEVLENQYYYLSSCDLEIGGKNCSQLHFLIPLDLLDLEQLSEAEEGPGDTEKAGEKEGGQTAWQAEPKEAGGAGLQGEKGVGEGPLAEILLVENYPDEADKIEKQLKNIGIASLRISFSDNIYPQLTSGLRLIIIVAKEIDEQAYGIAIKLRTMAGAPIVAAGSEWTRSKVIKAVRYGVTDILLTPAEDQEIREKIEANILKLAA